MPNTTYSVSGIVDDGKEKVKIYYGVSADTLQNAEKAFIAFYSRLGTVTITKTPTK